MLDISKLFGAWWRLMSSLIPPLLEPPPPSAKWGSTAPDLPDGYSVSKLNLSLVQVDQVFWDAGLRVWCRVTERTETMIWCEDVRNPGTLYCVRTQSRHVFAARTCAGTTVFVLYEKIGSH